MRCTPALFLLLAGCWPYLPGGYSDYVEGDTDTDTDGDTDVDTTGDGDDYTLIGQISYSRYRGGYWGDNANGSVDGASVWFGLVPGNSQKRYLDAFGGEQGDCVFGEASHAFFSDFRDVGVNTVGLSGGRNVNMTFSSADAVWIGGNANNVDWGFGTTFDMETMVVNGEDLGISGLVQMPGNVRLTSPQIDGDGPATVSRNGLTLQWTGAGGSIPIIQVSPADSEFQPTDNVSCTAPGESAFRVPTNDLVGWDTAAGAYISFGVAIPTGGSLGNGAGHNGMTSMYWQQGFVYFE